MSLGLLVGAVKVAGEFAKKSQESNELGDILKTKAYKDSLGQNQVESVDPVSARQAAFDESESKKTLFSKMRALATSGGAILSFSHSVFKKAISAGSCSSPEINKNTKDSNILNNDLTNPDSANRRVQSRYRIGSSIPKADIPEFSKIPTAPSMGGM